MRINNLSIVDDRVKMAIDLLALGRATVIDIKNQKEIKQVIVNISGKEKIFKSITLMSGHSILDTLVSIQ